MALKQIKIEDFHIGFEYEQYVLHSARYMNQGHIWLKKTYTTESARLHKIQKLIDSGEVRHVTDNTFEKSQLLAISKQISNTKWWQFFKRNRLHRKEVVLSNRYDLEY